MNEDLRIENVLKQYLAIQKQEQKLRAEKAELQQTLAEHMKKLEREQWFPDVEGQKVKVQSRETVQVDYNEDVLRERLQDRYSQILAPDIKKIRKNLKTLESVLKPELNRIGTPFPDKVRAAIESGIVTKEEFNGAFEKSIKRNVSVSKITKPKE
jgi:hypothetical protein